MSADRSADFVEQPGAITIARTTASHAADYITVTIRIGDEDVQARLSLENFAYAVTGLGMTEAEVDRRPRPGRAVRPTGASGGSDE